jgi:hypothetical protein
MVAEVTGLVLLAAAATWASGRRGLRRMALPLTIVLTMQALFVTLYTLETARRLSVAWLAVAFALGCLWDRLEWPRWLAAAALLVQGLASFRAFWIQSGAYYPGPGGLFYPSVLWVRLSIEQGPWPAALAVAILLASLLASGIRVLRLIGVSGR